MSWLDPLIVLAVLASMGAGWTFGSVWYSSGLAAGFIGLWAADIYGPVVAGDLGHWSGAEAAGTILVFVVVAAAVVAAGWLVRKVLSAAFLGFIDRVSGLAVGGAAGAALTLLVISILLAVRSDWRAHPAFRGSFFLSHMQIRSPNLSLPSWTRLKPKSLL